MTVAIRRLMDAIEQKEKIVIYGDYDVDGVTATALLVRVLRSLGADIAFFLPNRIDEGYGLTTDGLDRCLSEHSPRLLIAVDCGTSSRDQIAGVKQSGVDVIVLDHHTPPANGLPDCPVVNPKRLSENPLWKDLCSAGIAFKFAHALLKSANLKSLPAKAGQISNLKSHLDLVALGTIADIVPLTGENRILARAGLAQIGQTEKIGLKKLMEKADVPHGKTIEPSHVGFRLGPRLNAAGRLGDAQAALELLLTEDEHRAEKLASFLDINNRERQQTEKRVLEEAMGMLSDFDASKERAIVLAKEGWHIGVVGIVAARIVREFYRPTCIIGIDPSTSLRAGSDGMGRGSCRSIHGFDITAALGKCSGLLDRFGGHTAAAGLSVRSEFVEKLRKKLNAIAAEQLKPEDLQPRLEIDAEVSLADVTEEMLAELEELEPFGCDNPTPLFCARNLEVKNASTVGADGKHLRLRLSDSEVTLSAIGFGLGSLKNTILNPPSSTLGVDVVFTADWNEFQGRREIQLNLKDVRVSTAP